MFGKNKNTKFDKYVDPTGELPNSELKLAEWYVRHKLRMQKLGTGFLLLFCVVTIGYSFSYWVYYFSFGYFNDQAMMESQVREITNYTEIQPLYGAVPLKFAGLEVLQSASDRYDFVTRVANPNERWVAYLHYKFTYGAGQTAEMVTPIMPKSERPVIYFGQKADGFPSGARLQVVRIEWYKVNAHFVEDIAGMLTERLNFKLNDFQFIGTNSFGEGNENVKLSLFNDTPFTYWQVDFYVELIADNQTVGFMYVPVEKFKAKELRSVEARLPLEGLKVEDLKIYPIVDIFSSRSFMRPGE